MYLRNTSTSNFSKVLLVLRSITSKGGNFGKVLAAAMFLLSTTAFAQQEANSTTTFKFGGYLKADFINTWYMNGDVGGTSPLRDFHLPGQIPVGDSDRNFDLDYHVKESRFNFDVKTKLLGKDIHGFIEVDFLLSAVGDERVSNSFNPRLRHFYVEWDRLLIGQTWSTFMIVVVPDELDFTGATDGLVAARQPQIRYKAGDWWFSIENPETTINGFQSSDLTVTDSEILPDIVVRRNFSGDWGNWSIATLFRTLHNRAPSTDSSLGFGLTTGGKLKIGNKGDDLRMMFTGGTGLGRYLAANFVTGAVLNDSDNLNTIGSVNGYVAYNHFWKNADKNSLSSSFSISSFRAFNDEDIASPALNKSAFSISGNLKYDPVKVLRLGVEYMLGYREIQDGTDGAFHRIQFAAKYVFGYNNTEADEKK